MERIGFVGIVLDDNSVAPRVNEIIGQYADMVTCLLYTSRCV